MKLSTTQRRILAALTADGWAIRRNPIGRYELCEPIGRSGAGVPGPVLGAMRRAGWLTDGGTAGKVFVLSAAGRARAEQERAA
jgi:hypothetical protein